MNDRIRVVLVDDHEIVRNGLRLLLKQQEDIEVVGEAGDGEEALSKVAILSPDVVIMDIRMPKMNGIEATRRLKNEQPSCKVLVLSMYSDYAAECIEAGVDGYIIKDTDCAKLTDAIRQVCERKMPLEDRLNSVHELDLVIPPAASAAQITEFLAQLRKTLDAIVRQTIGCRKLGTTITVGVASAPLTSYLDKLREIPSVATVEEKQEQYVPKGAFFKKQDGPSSVSGSRKEIIVTLK